MLGLGTCLGVQLAQAQSVSEYGMKAILFYRLSQFVYWPADSKPPTPLSLCVAGKNPFGSALQQIDQNIARGEDPWSAIIHATEHRLRPILLTAAAAILGMIPIAPTVFWGPMAYAVMGGLAVATLLTLVFLPALYAAWFRIPAPMRKVAA